MNEYSYLLKDVNGVYTISNGKIQAVKEFSEHNEDFNQGFFNLSDIINSDAYSNLAVDFYILICERVLAPPSYKSVEEVDATPSDVTGTKFAISYLNNYLMPNGNKSPLQCDKSLFPSDVRDYSKDTANQIMTAQLLKSEKGYNFYQINFNKNHWKSINGMEAYIE